MSAAKPAPAPVNAYAVNASRWRRWSIPARRTFNTVFHTLMESWDLITPNTLHDAKPAAIRVTAWNTAWIAADAANGGA